MKEGAVIRPMTLRDLDTIMRIENKAFADPWSRRSYEYEIRKNRFSIAVVLEQNRVIIGSAVVWTIYEEFHIATISIAPEHQGEGWGTYFLTELLKLADSADYALLEVRKTNTAALKLYKNFGFYLIGTRFRYYKNGEDALVMKKELR